MRLAPGALLSLLLLLGCATTEMSEKSEVGRPEKEACKKYYDFGFEYLKNGSYDDATLNFRRAVDCSTGYVEAYIGLAQSYMKKGDTTSAESAYASAERNVPEDPRPYCGRATLCINRKEYEKAKQQYLMALSVDSLNFAAMFGLGYVYELMGDTGKAIEYYRRAKAIEPENTACRFRLGKALIKVGKSDEGLVEIRYVVDIHPEDLEARRTLAESYMEAKRYKDALLQFQAIVERVPDDINAVVGVGRASVKLKRYSAATDALNRARSIAPESPGPLYYLADMYIIRGKASSAKKILDEALARNFNDEVPFYVLYGDLHFKSKQYEKAIIMYKKAVNDQTYGRYARNQIKRAEVRLEQIRLEEEGF